RNNATGGAGLGLSIARGIVALHGGLINYSRENGVTRFSFYINKS
ncbi:MAG: ATP-binding protein, partial [Desulfosudaceae bacterium]